MITMCVSRDDEHASFPHRLVVPLMTITKHGETTVTISSAAYVICAHCDHWIERTVTNCRCREHCHDQASVARAVRYRNVTKRGGAEPSASPKMEVSATAT